MGLDSPGTSTTRGGMGQSLVDVQDHREFPFGNSGDPEFPLGIPWNF